MQKNRPPNVPRKKKFRISIGNFDLFAYFFSEI